MFDRLFRLSPFARLRPFRLRASRARAAFRLAHEPLETRTLLSVSPVGVSFSVNDRVAGHQQLDGEVSSVAVSETAGTIVAYEGKSATDREGVYVRFFDTSGTATTDALRVNTTIHGTQSAAVAASNTAGNTVVVWEGRGRGDRHGIFLQRYDGNGTPLGSEQLVNQTVGGPQRTPAVDVAADGSFVVAWAGTGDGDFDGVFVRRFDADGVAVSDEERVNTTVTADQANPDVAVNTSGDYVVSWNSKDQDGDDWGIFAQRFSPNGTRQGTEIAANTTTESSQYHSSAAMQDDGTFMIAWSSLDQDGDSWGIVGRRFNADGSAAGNELIINTSTTGHQRRVELAGGGGQYLASWEAGTPDGSGWEIMAQALDAVGAQDGSETLVNSDQSGLDSGHQQNPSVDLSASGTGAIAWNGAGTTDHHGVFARRYQNDGPQENVAPDLAPISTQFVSPNNQLSVTVTATDANPGDLLTFDLDEDNSPANATLEQINNNSAVVRWTPTAAQENQSFNFRVVVTDDGTPELADSQDFTVTVSDTPASIDLNGTSSGTDTESSFILGAGAVDVLGDDVTISDADGGTIQSALAQIVGVTNTTTESLAIDTLDTGITASFNSATSQLSLTGTDTAANYERVLKTLQYNNASTDPTGNRTVQVTVNDGTINSNTAESVVRVQAPDLVAFAQAIAASGTQYFGAAWCPFCTAQKEDFQDGGHFLPFIEVTNPDRSLNQIGVDNNISTFPTWVFPDQTRLTGQQTLQTLSARTGVAIPTSDQPFLDEIEDGTLLIGSPLHVPLDGYDPNGGQLTYTVSTDNPNVTAEVLSGNRSIRMDVAGYGDMVFQLFEDRAPRATDRMIELSDDNFYDGIIFHRVINNFVIQGGDPTGTGSGGSDLGDFDDQFHPDLQHNRTGLLSMAKTTDDTNDSQFFVTEGTARHLDFNHTIFGILTEGEAHRDAISDTEVDGNDRPTRDVVIETTEVFTDIENGVVMLKAAPGTTGTVTVTVTVSDEDGNTFQRQFDVTVREDNLDASSNSPPFLADIAPVSINRNTAAQIQLAATDVEGDQVFFGATKLGTVNYTFDINASTGLLEVTPPTDFTGTMQIRVGVGRTSSAGDDLQTIDIEVL